MKAVGEAGGRTGGRGNGGCLLIALISVIAIAAITAAGKNIKFTFDKATDGLISGDAVIPTDPVFGDR